ncbi:hypothetical protein ACFSQ7_17940 [Paenibacillus rhizoplanae]
MNHRPGKLLLSTLMIATTLFTPLGTALGASAPSLTGITGHWAQGEVTDWVEKKASFRDTPTAASNRTTV